MCVRLQVLADVYGVHINKEVAIAVVVPLIVMSSWIRNLDELASFSTMANLCILFSIAVILYDEIDRFVTSNPGERAAVREENGVELSAARTIPLYFGSVAFAFEAIGVVLPLENKMAVPTHAVRVMVAGMAVVTLLYTLFGVAGYLTYGADIKASVTLNLESSNIAEKM